MNSIPYDTPEQDWDRYEADEGEGAFALPGRPRRRFWGRGTAALLALLVGAIGFYAGVRVEKGQISSSTASTGSGRGFAGLSGAGAAGAVGGGARGAAGAAGAGGSAAGFRALAAGGAGGAGASFGTVSSVAGKTVYVTDTSGNTVKVNLSSATKITKSLGVSKSAVRPGDTVIIQGLKSSNGTVDATSLNDSGARSAGSGSGASSGGSGSASSAVNSLFGGG
jgi:hypothetical protein